MLNFKIDEQGEYVTACERCGQIFKGKSENDLKILLSSHVLRLAKTKSHEQDVDVAMRVLQAQSNNLPSVECKVCNQKFQGKNKGHAMRILAQHILEAIDHPDKTWANMFLSQSHHGKEEQEETEARRRETVKKVHADQEAYARQKAKRHEEEARGFKRVNGILVETGDSSNIPFS